MKRFHVNVRVKDITESVAFYNAMFNAEPTVVKEDYAKWMLEDPRINFAISLHPEATGIEHLGIQAESPEELQEVYANLKNAKASIREEGKCACCYAKSEKAWVTDPQGVSWEAFYTFGTTTVYGEGIHSRDNKVFFKEATEKQREKIAELLQENKLPTADIKPEVKLFALTQKGKVIGSGGLEVLGTLGLVRSVSIEEAQKGKGLGRFVAQELEDFARKEGLKELYLLTTTAKDFFERLNYSPLDREAVPAEVQQTSEFASVCPASATVMRKVLA
jgi:N-acetylglutamate synthase-like GNAT family acetyltransferase